MSKVYPALLKRLTIRLKFVFAAYHFHVCRPVYLALRLKEVGHLVGFSYINLIYCARADSLTFCVCFFVLPLEVKSGLCRVTVYLFGLLTIARPAGVHYNHCVSTSVRPLAVSKKAHNS